MARFEDIQNIPGTARGNAQKLAERNPGTHLGRPQGSGVRSVNTTTLQRLLSATGKGAVAAQRPESRCVESLDYNLEEETLTVEFVQRGTYEYTGVSLDAYVDFAQSGSLGKYFNANIRDQFSYRKVA